MSTEPGAITPQDDRTMRRVLIFFAVILAVLVLIAVESLRNLNRTIATSDWVNHTHALLNELDALQPSLLAAEGDLNRYLLTDDARDHRSYQNRFAELGERVSVVTALVAGSPEEQKRFAPIADLLVQRAELAKRIADLQKKGDLKAVRALLIEAATPEGDPELARRIEKFRESQTDLLSARDRASFQQSQVTRWTIGSGLVFELLLLAGAAWLIREDLKVRRLAARLLQQANERLEENVRQRTAELTIANESLMLRNLEERWAKQALEHQNRYNLLIIDSISDAVIVVTKLMNISRMNPAAIHLVGVEPANLIDRPIAEMLRLHSDTGATRPGFDLLTRSLTDGHELSGRAASLTTGDNRILDVRLSLYPLRDRDKIVGGVVILRATTPSTS